jgi:hypothetical protein
MSVCNLAGMYAVTWTNAGLLRLPHPADPDCLAPQITHFVCYGSNRMSFGLRLNRQALIPPRKQSFASQRPAPNGIVATSQSE